MRRKNKISAAEVERHLLLARARSGLRIALAFHPDAPENASPRRKLLDDIDANELRELAGRLDHAEVPPPGVRRALEALDEMSAGQGGGDFAPPPPE